MKICIIGGGPIGLTLALYLKKLKIPFSLFEKNKSIKTHPAAHFIQCRSMEIFDQIKISEKIFFESEKISDYKFYRHCRRIGDKNEYAKIDHFFPNFEKIKKNLKKNFSYQNFIHIPQNNLEEILYEKLKNEKNINFDHELINFKNDKKSKKIKIEILNKKKNLITKKNFDLLISCDGFKSKIRKISKIDLDQKKPIMKFLNIFFISKKLTNYIKKNNLQAMLHFVYNSDICSCLINYSYTKNEFAMHLPLTDSEFENYIKKKNKNLKKKNFQNFEIFEKKNLEKKIKKMLVENFQDIDIDIKYEGFWEMNNSVAKSFYEENVVLVGDSAHAFPPSGGFGLNSGIEDVANLVQKLMVLKNYDYDFEKIDGNLENTRGDPMNLEKSKEICDDFENSKNFEEFNKKKEKLLTQYSQERRYNINQIRNYAMKNFEKQIKFSSGIGFNKNGLDILETINQVDFLKNSSFLENTKKFFTLPMEVFKFKVDKSLLIKLNDFEFEFNTKNFLQKNIIDKNFFFEDFEEKNFYRGFLFKHLKLEMVKNEKNENFKNFEKNNIFYSRELLTFINNTYKAKPFFIFTNCDFLEKIENNDLFHVFKENGNLDEFEIFDIKVKFGNLKEYYDLVQNTDYVILIRSDHFVENIYIKKKKN